MFNIKMTNIKWIGVAIFATLAVVLIIFLTTRPPATIKPPEPVEPVKQAQPVEQVEPVKQVEPIEQIDAIKPDETLAEGWATFTYIPMEGEIITSVSLRGSFNNWGELPMEELPDGTWSISLYLGIGVHEYKFFINGQWPTDMETARGGGPIDPEADKYVDDGHEGQNAVRIIQPKEAGAAPRHNPDDPAHLSIADERLTLRIRTFKADMIKSINMVSNLGSWPMERQLFWDGLRGSGEMWRVSIPVPQHLEYHFVGIAFYGGEYTTFSVPSDPDKRFLFDGTDPFPQIEWVGQSVFYQIFPERFFDGNPKNNAYALNTSMYHYNEMWKLEGWYPTTLSAWNDPKTPQHGLHQYFGGDLAGIVKKLPYLQKLGITGLYLNPIFQSGSAHGFDTHCYRTICPKFGTEADLRRLLDEAHARDMKVIFDFVPNHTGLGFWAFQDIVKRGEESPYWDWYFIHKWPFTPGDATAYRAWWGLGSLPQLNTANPEVKKYLFDVALKWLDFGFDGIRVDVPGDLVDPHTFFAEMRRRVRIEHPDAWLIGEIWQLAPVWLQGDQFDTLMNYALGLDILLPFAGGDRRGEDTLDKLSHYFAAYGENVAAMGFNVITSHDTSRVLTKLGGGNFGEVPDTPAIARWKLLSTLLYSMPGAPVIFQGDERGILGKEENFNAHRYPIQWDIVNKDLMAHFIELARIRREVPALTSSVIRAYKADEHLLAFFRGEKGNGEALVVANNSVNPAVFELPTGTWQSFDEMNSLQGVITIPSLQVQIFLRKVE